MNKLQKGLVACIDALDAVRIRVTEVLQSEEAKAFARKLKSEASKEKVYLEKALRGRALRVVAECEKKLAQAKSLLGQKSKPKKQKK